MQAACLDGATLTVPEAIPTTFIPYRRKYQLVPSIYKCID
jgi:hypothetical protein